METFKLIVDSVEGLRELTKQFEEPEPIVIKRGKKEVVSTVHVWLKKKKVLDSQATFCKNR